MRDRRLSLEGTWRGQQFIRGEILGEELQAAELSAAALARLIEAPANRVSRILVGRRAVTADTALRLGHYFGTSAELWLNLQKMYELDLARAALGASLERLPQRPLVEA